MYRYEDSLKKFVRIGSDIMWLDFCFPKMSFIVKI